MDAANGAAQVFSQTSAAATVPGSRAWAMWPTSSSESSWANSAPSSRSAPASPSSNSCSSKRVDLAALVLGDDEQVEHAHCARLDQLLELLRHRAGEVCLAGRELDHEVVDRSQLVHDFVVHQHSSPAWIMRWVVTRYSHCSRTCGRPRLRAAGPRGDVERDGEPDPEPIQPVHAADRHAGPHERGPRRDEEADHRPGQLLNAASQRPGWAIHQMMIAARGPSRNSVEKRQHIVTPFSCGARDQVTSGPAHGTPQGGSIRCAESYQTVTARHNNEPPQLYLHGRVTSM